MHICIYPIYTGVYVFMYVCVCVYIYIHTRSHEGSLIHMGMRRCVSIHESRSYLTIQLPDTASRQPVPSTSGQETWLLSR